MASRFSKLFSIGAQCMALVVVLVGLTAWMLPRLLVPEAEKVVVGHELLDLREETAEWGWALIDKLDMLRTDVAQLSLRLGGNDRDLTRKGGPLLQQMRQRYLRIEIWPVRKADGHLVFPAAPAITDLGGLAVPAEASQQLKTFKTDAITTWQRELTERSPGMVTSRIERSPLELTEEAIRRGENLGQNQAQYVVWSARYIRDAERSGAGVGEEGWALAVAMSMDDVFRRISASPRHLSILFQGKDVLLHPVGALVDQENAEDYREGTKALFEGQLYGPDGKPREDFFITPETWRLTVGRTIDSDQWPAGTPTLADHGVKFYFCESKDIKGLDNGDRRVAAKALEHLNASWAAEAWAGRDPCLRRVWGFDETRPRIRLLASDAQQLPKIQEVCLETLRLALPEQAERFSNVRWQEARPGQTCDLNFVRAEVFPDEPDRAYILGRAQFREELAADLAWELAGVRYWAWAWAAVAAAVALVFSLLITRPLKRITKTALALTKNTGGATADGEHWERSLANSNGGLPTSRRDEIGVLALAFQRMLEEIRESHGKLLQLNRDLEARVQRRTRELTEANRELHETNAKLTDAHAAQKRFVFSISHDLKTPLTTVKGYCELLMQSPLTEEQREDLTTIYVARERLQRLIEDVLDSQKIDLRDLELDWKEFDPAELVREVGRGMVPSAEKKGNTLRVECQEGIPPMCADPDKISRVLTNLLSNACKFTSQGTITLRAACEQRDGRAWLLLTVADTGPGISPAHQDKIFKPFPKIMSKAENPEGTGLGLSNCRGYCEAMGGTIDFTTEPGQGTTFTAWIPLRPDENGQGGARVKERQAARAEVARGPARALRPSNCILVIDDEAEIRHLMQRFLEKQGFAVETAASGDEGLARARQVKPVLITLDALMPGRDGWTVLKELKSDPETCDTPVIMVSVLDDKYKGYALGASDYVTKPIDWERLTRTLGRFRLNAADATVLVVDDDPEIRAMASRQLSSRGWNVMEAENGRAALDLLRDTCPSAILLDLLMPAMDGFEFLRQMRANEQWCRVPVLVVTAKDLTAAEREQLKGRVVQIIQKEALRWDELELEIDRLLAQHVAKDVPVFEEAIT